MCRPGQKVACNDKELCGVVFQGHEGDEEYQGEEEFLEDAERDKELPFLRRLIFCIVKS